MVANTLISILFSVHIVTSLISKQSRRRLPFWKSLGFLTQTVGYGSWPMEVEYSVKERNSIDRNNFGGEERGL